MPTYGMPNAENGNRQTWTHNFPKRTRDCRVGLTADAENADDGHSPPCNYTMPANSLVIILSNKTEDELTTIHLRLVWLLLYSRTFSAKSFDVSASTHNGNPQTSQSDPPCEFSNVQCGHTLNPPAADVPAPPLPPMPPSPPAPSAPAI